MSTLKTMTLDELRKTPLTEAEKQTIRSAAANVKSGKTIEDPDCPRQTKEELSKFRPWYEVHPDWYKPTKTEIHIRVDTTYSAVRLTHIPTGIVVAIQDEKSQIKNYEKALKVLRTRIYEIEYQKYLDEISSKRKTMVSTGDRSAKIRTYNYPQSRVTDHRINFTTHTLGTFMDGDIQELIDALQLAENAEKMKESVG